MMADDPNGRMKAARDLKNMTLEELTAWAVQRAPDDSYRQHAVKGELDKRAVAAAQDAAQATRAASHYERWWPAVIAVAAVFLSWALSHWWPF